MKNKIIMFLLGIILFSSCKNESPQQKNHMNNNPLLEKWTTPFEVPPFDKIKNEHFLPALRTGIKEQAAEIDAISNSKEQPSFQNTVEAMERSGKTLKKVSAVFYSLTAAHTNDDLKKVEKTIAPELASHRDNINLNKPLFQRVKAVYDQKETLKLSSEEIRLLEKRYKDFVDAGVSVEGEDEKRLRVINMKLASLSQQYGDNVLEETNNFEVHTTDEKDLGNLSASLIALAADEAKTRGHDNGWSFTLQRPSVNPFLQSSPNRELREQLYQGYAKRGDNDNKYDNKAIVSEMASLRYEKAKMLGFDTYADYSLSNAMAQNPTAVYELMDQLWEPTLAMTKKDKISLAKMMKEDGVNADFRGSDWRYYVEKYRKEAFDFEEEETRPYFEFTAVRQGAFQLATKLFGMKFKELKDMPKWHEDQEVFEVTELDGDHIGVLYMDYFARPSKRGGAWMNELRSQSKLDGDIKPVVTNNFNYPRPANGNPSLLSFTEAQTLFHEFGHALHGLLSDVKYGSLSGTNVPRDFVEFPSQVMENWMSEPEVLQGYAKHYKTKEVIPNEMIERMNKANNFNVGFATLEYMAAAYLDMNWHALKTTELQDAGKFEKEAMDKLGLIPEVLPRYRSQYFGHIFSGGYAAGYYSYLWSEVLDADTFEAFKKTGDIFDKDLSVKYRKMLSAGGSKTGMELYESLMGRAPKIDALLKKKGFN